MALQTCVGEEYFSNEFFQFLGSHCIAHRTTCAYIPQQNGLAERMYRIFLHMVQSMMAH